MRELEIVLREGDNPSNIGFATSMVSLACEFTDCDINIQTDENTWVDLKSIMGVLTLNYKHSRVIRLQITGGSEEYCYSELNTKVPKLISKFSN